MYSSLNLNKYDIKINRIAIWQYFLIYLVIQYIGGRVLTAIGSDIFYSLTLLVCCYLLLTMRQRFMPNLNSIRFISILTFLSLMTFIYTIGGLSIGSILSLISRFIIIYFAIKIDPENFLNRFLKMIYIFSIISIILYLLVVVIGMNGLTPIYSRLYEIPSGKYWMGSTYGIFLIVFNFMDPSRNAYMFGEPGEYQSLIITAIFFLLFVDKSLNNKNKIKYLIVFLITLVTIQSTTGYINLIAIIITCIFLSRKRINGKFKAILFSLVIIFITYVIFFASKDSFIYTNFFNKILNDSESLDLTVSTGYARIDPLERFLLTLKNTPLSVIFGVGFEGLKNTDMLEYSTCGLINNILMFGSFVCIYMYSTMVSVMKYTTNSFLLRILVLFIVINMGISQPDLLSIMSVLILCYGWIVKDKSVSCKDRKY